MEKTISRLSLLLIRTFRLLLDILESNMALYHPLNFLSLIFLVCSLSLSLSSFSFCFIAPFLVCTTNNNNNNNSALSSIEKVQGADPGFSDGGFLLRAHKAR